MGKRLILYLFSLNLFISYSAQSQDINLDQYYYSKFEPKELNQNSEEEIKTLYKVYSEHYAVDIKKIDEKKFVYEYNYFNDRLNRSGNVFYGDSISNYLNELKNQIISDNDKFSHIKIYLTDFPSFNAFTNDFGSIYVNIGAFARINSEQELLYLLAHEIAHVKLRHSHKSEIQQKEWESVYSKDKLDKHLFSKEQELKADSLAFEMLKSKIDPKNLLNLFEGLRNSENPIYSGRVDYKFLISSDDEINYLDSIQSSMKNDTVYFPLEESDSLSTHPSIDARIAQTLRLMKNSKGSYARKESERFLRLREESHYLLINSLLRQNEFITALDLILKMRMNNTHLRNSPFLIESQIKSLISICQRKYRNIFIDQILNNKGNSCSDIEYLKFRKLILSLANVDLNILTYKFIQDTDKHLHNIENISTAEKKIIQFLYAENEGLFDQNSQKKYYIKAYTDSCSLELKKPDSTKNEFIHEMRDKLEKIGFRFVPKNSKGELLNIFIKENPSPDSFHNYIIEYLDYKSKSSLVPSSEFEILIHPAKALKKFHRGHFYKSTSFKPGAKTVLIESLNFFLRSKNKAQFKLDYEKTLELETQMNNILSKYNYSKDISNSSKSRFSVADNYYRKITLDWISSKTTNDKVHYSIHDNEIKNYFSKFNSSYIVQRICIVNRNLGIGKRFYVNYYEIYVDYKNNQIVYLSRIASKEKPDKFHLENLNYISNLHKKNDL